MSLTIKPHNAKKALSVEEAAGWCKAPVMEPKWDGWRMIAIIDGHGCPRLWSRAGKPYHKQTPEPILKELEQFPPNTVLDGEMVDSTHNKNCTAVTNVFGKSKSKALPFEENRIHYIVFDCIELGGEVLATEPLCYRREVIDILLDGGLDIQLQRIALTPQAPAEQEYHALFLELGYEGTMVKDNESTYAFGKRGHGWFKIKSTVDIDVVIMRMELDGKGQHEGKVGRFVVGQYQMGELCERARVNPYDDAMRNAFTAAVIEAESGGTNEFIGKVCTIRHYGVLKDGLRHPVFVTWREDKPAKECEFDNGD